MLCRAIVCAIVFFCILHAVAVPTPRASGPTVQLDSATFVGVSSGPLFKFLGIPFAQPPTGNRRFNIPVPVGPYSGIKNATAYGPVCPQQGIILPIQSGPIQTAMDQIANSAFAVILPASEDCLTINVIMPAYTTPASKLPVVVWFFAGGFEYSGASVFDGDGIVERAIGLGKPVIYVSMNYRSSAWGFLGGQEIKDAGVGNLGLRDQREALRWVQKYIGAFGGDPTKVTIWGISSGAISVALQMLTNGGNTEGLFRGAFMQSGSPTPVGDITHGQKYYDFIVDHTGCSGDPDTLNCLRRVDSDTLKKAVDATPSLFSYESLALAYMPRTDGDFLKADPLRLVLQGSVADVPFVSGDCDDEGTLFSFGSLNVTTDAQFIEYMQTISLPSAPSSMIQKIANLYPSDITQGSPYNTGALNALTPQFKRIASIQGDAVFQLPRRFFIQQRFDKQNIWSYLITRLKATPFLGSSHGSDVVPVFLGSDMTDHLINFVTKLDPNFDQPLLNWPKYTNSTRSLMLFQDGPGKIVSDTYRQAQMEYGLQVLLEYPM